MPENQMKNSWFSTSGGSIARTAVPGRDRGDSGQFGAVRDNSTHTTLQHTHTTNMFSFFIFVHKFSFRHSFSFLFIFACSSFSLFHLFFKNFDHFPVLFLFTLFCSFVRFLFVFSHIFLFLLPYVYFFFICVQFLFSPCRFSFSGETFHFSNLFNVVFFESFRL